MKKPTADEIRELVKENPDAAMEAASQVFTMFLVGAKGAGKDITGLLQLSMEADAGEARHLHAIACFTDNMVSMLTDLAVEMHPDGFEGFIAGLANALETNKHTKCTVKTAAAPSMQSAAEMFAAMAEAEDAEVH